MVVTNSSDNESVSSKDTTKSAGTTTVVSHSNTKYYTSTTSTPTTTLIHSDSTPMDIYEYSDSSGFASTIGTTVSAVYNGHERAGNTAYINILFSVILTVGKLQEN